MLAVDKCSVYFFCLRELVSMSKLHGNKFRESESRSVISDSLQPRGPYSPWNSPGQNPGVGSLSLSSPAEPQEKPKNTGVGSLSLLQEIFLTEESNLGLLHCRWILYQLSYQGSSKSLKCHFIFDLVLPKERKKLIFESLISSKMPSVLDSVYVE